MYRHRQKQKEKKMQEKLRKEIKLLKALYGITYRELADCLEI